MEYAVIWIMSQRILIHLRGAYLTPLAGDMGLFTESGSAEARAQQTSAIVSSQIPRPSPISAIPDQPSYRHGSDKSLVVDVGNNYDTALTDFNVEVRIDRTIIRDTKPDEESIVDRDLYAPQKSDWNGTHGSDV